MAVRWRLGGVYWKGDDPLQRFHRCWTGGMRLWLKYPKVRDEWFSWVSWVHNNWVWGVISSCGMGVHCSWRLHAARWIKRSAGYVPEGALLCDLETLSVRRASPVLRVNGGKRQFCRNPRSFPGIPG